MSEPLTTKLGCLQNHPRQTLYGQPTVLERLPRLSAANTGGTIWAKRDDAYPLAFGGNKVRQLEYYFGAALSENADTVLITGAVQSNFCRLCAAFAAKLGLDCHIQLEERVAQSDAQYRASGNVLVERMLGATLHSYHAGEDESGADARLEELAAELRTAGRRPYVIHLAPDHPPLGALGYIHCAEEILADARAAQVRFDHVAVGSGSGATHAGLLFGLRALGSDVPVTGICVRREASLQKPRIEQRCRDIADLLGVPNPVAEADVVVNDRFLGPGYGMINFPTERAIRIAARTEAMILDPVYTGKCMAGALAIAGNARSDQNILFLHTGGTPAVFAYESKLAAVLGD